MNPLRVIDEFVERAYLMREWVGPDVELAFDFHGKMTPALAIEICHEIKGMRPMFVEEPIPQENVDALKLISDHVPFPIATGERLLTRWGFREIFEKQAVAYLQPDTSHAGGITELKKIANMAEVYYMHIAPHCAIGPVAFSASLHVDAVVPNFLIQEQIDDGLGAGLLAEEWQVTDGHVELPTKPGLGFEINEQEAERTLDTYPEELGRRVLLRYRRQRSRLVGTPSPFQERVETSIPVTDVEPSFKPYLPCEFLSKRPVSGLRHKVALTSTSGPRLTSDCGVHRRIYLVPMRRDLVST